MWTKRATARATSQTATFDEGEEREWDTFATHAASATRTEAMTWTSRLAHDYASVLCLLLAVDGSDGISVDVQPRVYDGRDYEPYAITDSWEVVPAPVPYLYIYPLSLSVRKGHNTVTGASEKAVHQAFSCVTGFPRRYGCP